MLIYIFVFFISAVFGSFINVVVCRNLRKMDFVFDRSRCLSCGKQLAFWETIPFVSYIVLKGKCRHCESKIPIDNLMAEIISALAGLICFSKFNGIEMIFYFVLMLVMLFISLLDNSTKEVKYRYQIALLVVVLVLCCYQNKIFITEAFCVFAVLLLILLLTKGLGGADVDIFSILTLLFGKKIIYIYFFSLGYGSIYALYLLIIKKANRKYQLAFVIFIFLGLLTYLLAEEEIFIINYLLFK